MILKKIDNVLNTIQLYLYKHDIVILDYLGNKLGDFRERNTIKDLE